MQNHKWVQEHLKSIDRTKLSKKLLKVVLKIDQNLLTTSSREGKIYANQAQRKYAAKLRKRLASARRGGKMEEDPPQAPGTE
jgi:hypothetical protein